MLNSFTTPARDYAKGIGDAVADRTINRKIEVPVPLYYEIIDLPRMDSVALDSEVAAYCKSKGLVAEEYDVLEGDDLSLKIKLHVTEHIVTEKWADVARRVAVGNSMLEPGGPALREYEFHALHHHLRQASVLMSGRHLQHGDETQPTRNQEVFTNCLDGSTRILTMEYGPIELDKIAGQIVTVIAGDGMPRPAMINEHGEQDLFEITFKPVKGAAGKFRKTVTATANHRWKLRDGSFTDAIAVGDCIAPVADAFGLDPVGITHGLIFGDGTAHKSRIDGARHFSQGRTYASIRVCKQDKVREEIHEYLDAAGYKFTTPPSAGGDRVYYIGKFEGAKEVPFSRDPEYIAGFIYGWWLADGSKNQFNSMEISTCDKSAAEWLEEHAAIAGFNTTMHRVMERKEGDGSFANGKALHCLRLRKGVEWKVESIEPVGRANVYCPEEPVTTSFVLANGLLTGNCSTAAVTFLNFYLLLNGSGVGRAYDDEMMLVDWRNMPITIPVIDQHHKDVQSGEITSLDDRNARHLYAGRTIRYFRVPDSREGWAKAIEAMERTAFKKNFRDDVLILDFSDVRPRGAPIAGMQNRPASGPGALMKAIMNIAALRDAGMAPWRSAMYADHYAAECVLVGGARRAARMATKYWKDKSVLEFIEVKRGGFLWSSNNSVTVDEEFWTCVVSAKEAIKKARAVMAESPSLVLLEKEGLVTEAEAHAKRVFDAICEAAYYDQTGEPGLINVDKLTWNSEGIEKLLDGKFAESAKYKLDDETLELTAALAKAFADGQTQVITNPCGEIVLGKLGGYCVIADVVPFHAGSGVRGEFWMETTGRDWDDDAEDAFRVTTRALIRTNLMDSLYSKEVARTNRIGVGMTGVHEYAWARFGYGWKDLVNEKASLKFWLTLSRFKRAIQDEAREYSQSIGVAVPHTNTTMKPAGCASLDSAIKTTEGILTMRELFAKHGVTEAALLTMQDGTWIEPTIKTMVLDEGNVEREVTKLYLNGVKPVYEIEFEDGTVVKLTGNHKLKTVSGEWKRVDELTEDDEILQY